MTYHQVLNIGEDQVQVTIEYTMDDDTYAVIEKIIHNGNEIPAGILEWSQIESIQHTLEAGHEQAVREMDWLHGEDVAADRAAFREAYRDHPLGI